MLGCLGGFGGGNGSDLDGVGGSGLQWKGRGRRGLISVEEGGSSGWLLLWIALSLSDDKRRKKEEIAGGFK